MGMSATGQSGVSPEMGLEPRMAELYDKSKAAEFGFSASQFLEILDDVASKTLPRASKQALSTTLHLEDLVLARACAVGHEHAWEVFMTRFREKLYDVAAYITKESSSARELADSVYADLYGTKTRESERISKLASYSGRGSLDGWLRTVLAQEYVNAYRKQRRLVSLDEESEDGVQFAAPAQDSSQSADARLGMAIDDELRSLKPEDRFILASYFLDRRTLAEIARALSVHESTISRKVEKLTKALRKQILKNLVRQGMGRRQAEETLSADVRDLALDVRVSLAQDSVDHSFSKKAAKAQEGRS